MNWKEDLKARKLAYLKKHHYDFYMMSGGERMKIIPYSDQTTNKLTTAVMDFLKYSGHYANRISSTGLMRNIKGKMQYTHGTSNLGTADVNSIIAGKPVAIEIKCSGTRDKMSKFQDKERKRIEQAGGTYLVVPTMEYFVNWYYQFTGEQSQVKQEENGSTVG